MSSAFRPAPGSVETNDPGFLCTLGFNIRLGGGARGFLTHSHSHCDSVRGPLRYDVNDSQASFILRALGKDGEVKQDADTAVNDIDPFERDMAMIDGAFVQRPTGETEDADTPTA